ncbi:MAG TPA: hypothetical protein H9825_10650 [Candidatus Sphingobacterium stercorigallinarum]|nr:hypothetical protein [Candidatus Sphingobacterium stercorigallinarum]
MIIIINSVYSYLLIAHSYLRWLVVSALVFQIVWFYVANKRGDILTRRKFDLLILLLIVLNLQFVLGWLLYLESPLVNAFWEGAPKTVKMRSLRFFGIEHMTMMSLAVGLSNLVVIRARKKIGTACFAWLFKSYMLVGVMIFTSVPWAFSPFTSRPNWR